MKLIDAIEWAIDALNDRIERRELIAKPDAEWHKVIATDQKAIEALKALASIVNKDIQMP